MNFFLHLNIKVEKTMIMLTRNNTLEEKQSHLEEKEKKSETNLDFDSININ